MNMARVGVLLDRKAAVRRWEYGLNVFQAYIGEILAHAGIPFKWVDGVEQLSEQSLDVLIVALERKDAETASGIWNFAERGGTVIACGRLSCLAGRLGFSEGRTLGPGYVQLPAEWGAMRPLRFLQAAPWIAVEKNEHFCRGIGRVFRDEPHGEESGAALLQFRVGKGVIDRWAVEIGETVVGLQQGRGPVIEDGIPAPDGTGSVDDGILKADDRSEMDWELDRRRTESGTPYFAWPYADWWREVLISHLLRRVTGRGMTLPFLGYWPAGISHVAMLSHDSDLNVDESAEVTLSVLEECGVKSTWCMLEPGYSPRIYQKVRAADHELAFHYNALEQDGGKWDQAEFRRQLRWLKEETGLETVTSNKNHYTRFEGWGELFRWCEACGIMSDQTRGPSKKGNVGFLFGTCHPYFPIAWSDERNRIYDVLEIGFLTQDLDHFRLADSSLIVPFLEQVRRVQGVAHFLFHQVHIYRQPLVREALRKVVAEAKQRGFVFLTGKQINDWERARRRVRIEGMNADGSVCLSSDTDLDDLVIWVPLPRSHLRRSDGSAVMKFGVPCVRRVVTVKAGGAEIKAGETTKKDGRDPR
ncbi:hypothetical protein H1164_04650 [Thermoactinomyces daqus]|uniref:Uncharacterized protein n=1 Tax=Thermoactinomyces daqus TaxID=1329516 RepID=A0A7W2AHI1_9BACL|nr:hypothetical protein [Thermoactinomyces daqus]MBA4542190.1 hypothetical protein [Thermoactinomyces daqus]